MPNPSPKKLGFSPCRRARNGRSGSVLSNVWASRHDAPNPLWGRSGTSQEYDVLLEGKEIEEKNVNTWEEFKIELSNLRRERSQAPNADSSYPLLFRGQEKSCWSLGTTLDRQRERMLFRDYYRVISKIRPQIESLISSSNCRNQHRHPVLAWEVMNLEYAGTGTIA